MGMAEFVRADLHGSWFERVDLAGAELRAVDMSGAVFRGVDLTGVVMRGVELVNADIYGEIVNLTVNGVDIGPLVEAELDRRYPDRAAMRPAGPAGFRQAWDTLERLWGQTVARARRLPPEVVLELRRDRMATVRQVIEGLTDAALDGHTEPVHGPGWPQPRSYPVRECLLCILNEEWEHRLYAERDLAVLESRRPDVTAS
jgi:Pentapeptide repeats (8 copies)/DinB superfamily